MWSAGVGEKIGMPKLGFSLSGNVMRSTMRMPDLGYVREWILRNTRILASIDLQPDMFQPGVSIQNRCVLIVERQAARTD